MLLQRLKQLQAEKNLTDDQFAKMLGYTRIHWVRIKTGKYPANDKFLMRVNRVFPEIFLSSDVAKDGKDVSSDATETLCNQKLGGFWQRLKDFITCKEHRNDTKKSSL